MHTQTQKTRSNAKANPVNSQRSPVLQYSRPILKLQHQIGNHAVQCLLQSKRIQAKLTIGHPNDKYEQEADRVADQIMRMPDSIATEKGQTYLTNHTPVIQRVNTKCIEKLQRQPTEEYEEEEENLLQAKEMPGQTPEVGSELEGSINSLRGGGQPLSVTDRSFFEPRFGQDFSQVRIHTDAEAAGTAKAINARAFTLGQDVVFGAGEYSSGSSSGKRLLAHELTHVVQQNGGKKIKRVSKPISPFNFGHHNVGDVVQCLRPDGRPEPLAGRPEDTLTYEMWIASFRNLPNFTVREGVNEGSTDPLGSEVIGERADRDPLNNSDASPDDIDARGYSYGDRYIDHPTRRWLEENLSPELLRTAYELPADCADVSFILRHVWLTAHGRTEVAVLNGRRFTLGVQRNASGNEDTPEERQRRIARAIRGGRGSQGVNSGNMADMVQPYADNNGHPLRSRVEVIARLHPGDLLVWEHVNGSPSNPGRVTGGHVSTVQSIDRSGGDPRIVTLFGNQPLFEDDVDALRRRLSTALAENRSRRGDTRAERRRLHQERRRLRREIQNLGGDDSINERRMRNTPGRRIERSVVPSDDFGGTVWARDDSNNNNNKFTWLVVAGPPRSAQRPAASGSQGMRAIRDWVPELNHATNLGQLQAILEATLTEVRSVIEGGDTVPPDQLQMIGEAIARRGIELGAALAPLSELMRAYSGEVVNAPDDPVSVGVQSTVNSVNPRASHVRRAFNSVLIASFTRVARLHSNLLLCPSRLREATDTTVLLTRFQQCVTDIQRARFTIPTTLIIQIGHAAGNTLWRFATQRARGGGTTFTGRDEHFNPLYQMRQMVRQDTVGSTGQVGRAGPTTGAEPALSANMWRVLDDALNMSGRGAVNISTRGVNDRTIRILVSGFDPFVFGRVPGSHDFNPSGAAAMAFDGQSVGTFGSRRSLVESVVYPVSFAEFNGGRGQNGGIVERVVRGRAADFDAVITVSMGMSTIRGSRSQDDPVVEIERYAIGSHLTGPIQTHQVMLQEQHPEVNVRIPRAAGQQGDPVIESNAPIDLIGRSAGAPVDSETTFGFSSARVEPARVAYDRAGQRAHRINPLVSPPMPATVDSHNQRNLIFTNLSLLYNLRWIGSGSRNRVRFRLNGQQFSASIVRGPGGSFLSNEVSYRSQRALQETHPNAQDRPYSFHVHTATDQNGQSIIRRVIRALRRVLSEVARAVFLRL